MSLFTKNSQTKKRAKKNLFKKQDDSLFRSQKSQKSTHDFFSNKAPSFHDAKTSASKKHSNNHSASRENPLNRLNKDQYEAATLPMGRSLIIASAGTGKTSTITGRIQFLFDNGVLPSEILLLTFTSKAAAEMTERVSLFFGESIATSITIGTFHASSMPIVKHFKRDHSMKMPRDVSLIFRSICGKRNQDSFMDEQTQPFQSATIFEKYGLFLNTCIDLVSFGEWITKSFPEHAKFEEYYNHIIEEFKHVKSKEKFYDFNDLLIIAKEYYLSNGSRYKEVIVDEYQDTNPLQSSVLDAMNPPSLYCVGDYDQSIYAFNGADISIIGNFTNKYKSASVYTLSKNYRSNGAILNLAELVISKNLRLYPKKLEVMVKEERSAPKLFEPSSQQEQVEIVCTEILSGAIPFGDTAIIFRSNSSGDAAEVECKIKEIPYVRKGGKSFFEGKEIQFVLALYKLVLGESSLATFLQATELSGIKPGFSYHIHHACVALGNGIACVGITKPDLSRIKHAFPKITENTSVGVKNIEFHNSQSLIDTLINKKWAKHPVASINFNHKSTYDFIGLLFDTIESMSSASTMSPARLVESIGASSYVKSCIRHYGSNFCRDSSGKVDTARLSDFVDAFMKKITILSSIALRKKNHKAFLMATNIKGDSEEDVGDRVQLLSVHASKGLEFESVHLIDVVDDIFPNTRLMNNGGGGLDEERRLFYVAATRAKQYLSIYAPKRIKSKDTRPSIFLYDGQMLIQK